MSAVVIVASASVDAARQAAITLDWLQRNGFDDLGNRACVVITQLVPGMPDTAVRELAKRFERRVQPGRIVVLPWDEHIACGTEIRLDLLDEAYVRRILELAAVLSDDFDQVVAR
jgi:MinD-like ATPase involved in chromosome partitioning or flagellar assembly